MGKGDPPPSRVKPTPIQLLNHAQQCVDLAPSDARRAIIDMTWIGYFYLLRPGEHCRSTDSDPLTLQDVRFQWGAFTYNPATCPINVLDAVTQSSITFVTQKNGQKGDTLAQGLSGDPVACPT